MGYEHCFNNNTMKYSFIYDIMVLSGLKVEPDNSYIKKENIESIERIDKKKAKDIYGKKGKNGALLISIK